MINNPFKKFYFGNERIVVLEDFEEIGLSKVCYVKNSETAFVKSSEIKNNKNKLEIKLKKKSKENEVYLEEKIEMTEKEIKSLKNVILLLKDNYKYKEEKRVIETLKNEKRKEIADLKRQKLKLI